MVSNIEPQQAAVFLPFLVGMAVGSETGRRIVRNTIHGVSRFFADLTARPPQPQQKEYREAGQGR
jgi:hypothetical protein